VHTFLFFEIEEFEAIAVAVACRACARASSSFSEQHNAQIGKIKHNDQLGKITHNAQLDDKT
jgi:restriction endonuclease